MQRTRSSLLVLAPLFALFVGALALAVPQQAAPPQGRPGGPPQKNPGSELVDALKNSPGCIGVEQAFTQTRKAVVFAWFKDKASVLDWYYSDFHQTQMMGLEEAAKAEAAAKAAAGGAKDDAASKPGGYDESRQPLENVADDIGPVLCIATITPAAPGQGQEVPGFPQAISQISIELYAPLPGGIAVNGKFAPAALKVPHMIEMGQPATEPKSAAAPPAK